MAITENAIIIAKCTNIDIDICNGCGKHFKINENMVSVGIQEPDLVCFNCLCKVYFEMCDIIVSEALYPPDTKIAQIKKNLKEEKKIKFRRYASLEVK